MNGYALHCLFFSLLVSACASQSANVRTEYVFTRVSPGAGSIPPFRQRYVLVLSGGEATLAIRTTAPARSELDSDLHWRANVKTVAGSFAFDFLSTDGRGTRPQWICTPIATHLYGPGRCDAAVAESVSALSCREDGQSDAPPSDRAAERHRDANRWTFMPTPGIEHVTDRCGSDGMLQRAR